MWKNSGDSVSHLKYFERNRAAAARKENIKRVMVQINTEMIHFTQN